jgi:hypothetical protein
LAIGAGIAVIDGIYAACGAAGAGPFLGVEPVRLTLGIAGGAILIVLGVRTLHSAFRVRLGAETSLEVATPRRAFLTSVAGTASNPETIASGAAIFAAAYTAGAAMAPKRRSCLSPASRLAAVGRRPAARTTPGFRVNSLLLSWARFFPLSPETFELVKRRNRSCEVMGFPDDLLTFRGTTSRGDRRSEKLCLTPGRYAVELDHLVRVHDPALAVADNHNVMSRLRQTLHLAS